VRQRGLEPVIAVDLPQFSFGKQSSLFCKPSVEPDKLIGRCQRTEPVRVNPPPADVAATGGSVRQFREYPPAAVIAPALEVADVEVIATDVI
jgi:hypothetical protein